MNNYMDKYINEYSKILLSKHYCDNKEKSDSYSAWTLKKISANDFWELDNDYIRSLYLINIGVLAPNSHNTQPWGFSLSDKGKNIVLYLDKERILPISDIKGRQAIISLGCVLTNIETACQFVDCNCSVIMESVAEDDLLPTQPPDVMRKEERFVKIATINTKSRKNNDHQKDALFEALFTRRIERGEYSPEKTIDMSIIEQIKSYGKQDSIGVILMNDWARKTAIAELQGQADSFVINNKTFAKEFINDWLLYNDSKSYFGMPGKTFRLNDEQTVRIKKRFEEDKGLEASDMTAMLQLSKRGILSSQYVGMITVDSDKPEQWLQAGRVLQKCALLFESKGISFAIHAGLAEVPQINMLMLRPIILSMKRPVILFRAGYLKEYLERSPHSPRVPIQDVLL